MRYTRQPQVIPSLDSPASGLSAIGNLIVFQRYDIKGKRGPNSTSSGTVTFASGKFGVARTFARASAAQDVYLAAPFSGDLTIYLVGGITAAIASEQRMVSAQAGTTKRFWLGENSTSNMAFVTNPSGGSEVTAGSGGTGDAVYVGRLSGTTMTLWKDGVQVSTGTQAASNWSDVDNLRVGNTAFLANPGGNVYLSGFELRAWSDAEIRAFYANPWAALSLPQRPKFAPAAVAGTTVNCTVGDEAEAGLAAAVAISTNVATAIYTETEAGPSASVTIGTVVTCTVGAETEAGPSAAVSISTNVACTVGDEAEAGPSAAVSLSTNIALSVANENEAGIITTVSVSTQVNCVIGNEAEAGLTASVTNGTTVFCTVGDEQEVGLGATVTASGGGSLGTSPWYQLAHKRGKR